MALPKKSQKRLVKRRPPRAAKTLKGKLIPAVKKLVSRSPRKGRRRIAARPWQEVPSRVEEGFVEARIQEEARVVAAAPAAGAQKFGAPPQAAEEERELPGAYGETRIVLMVRDPNWMHAYWEVAQTKKQEVESRARASWPSLRKVLRVYDVTGVRFTGSNAHRFFDIDINDFASNWYLQVGPDRAWCVDLGVVTASGEFILIARSNIARTPRDGVSPVTDEEWGIGDEEFYKLYALSGGFKVGAGSLELRQEMKKRLQEQISSGAFSGGLFSPTRPPKAKGFWLVVDCELIVYGATEPDAAVTLQGHPIRLRKDGTFSARFALPNGRFEFPVHAKNRDGDEERRITPIVSRSEGVRS